MESRWKSATALKDSLTATATSTLASAQDLALQAGDRAWSAGKAAGGVIGEKAGEAALRARALSADASIEIKSMADRVAPLVIETAGQASQHARQLSSKAASEVKLLGEQAVTTLRKLDENHEVIAERVENVSMAAGIASGTAAAVAFVAAPSGLAAAGVALGVTSAPLIVAAVPVLGAVETVAGRCRVEPTFIPSGNVGGRNRMRLINHLTAAVAVLGNGRCRRR